MLSKIKNKISIILPTLNESGHIESLIQNILKNTKSYNREIIVVDDNSSDGTISILKKLQKQKKINFILRLGKKSLRKSIQTGINKSKGNIICWMDADFSHHPKYLPQIINAVIFGGFDVAVNVRNFYKRKDNRFLHGSLSLVLNISLRILLFYKFKDYTSGFICIKKKLFPSKCSRQNVPAKCVFEIVPAKCLFFCSRQMLFLKVPAKCFWKKFPPNSF